MVSASSPNDSPPRGPAPGRGRGRPLPDASEPEVPTGARRDGLGDDGTSEAGAASDTPSAERTVPDPDAGPEAEVDSREPESLTEISTEDLRLELQRRQKALAKLYQQRDTLRRRLRDLEREIGELAGTSGATAPLPVVHRKPLADLTLAEAIARVVEIGEEFAPREAADRLVEAGYPAGAASFRSMVSQTLAKQTRFKRLSRGLYQRTA